MITTFIEDLSFVWKINMTYIHLVLNCVKNNQLALQYNSQYDQFFFKNRFLKEQVVSSQPGVLVDKY